MIIKTDIKELIIKLRFDGEGLGFNGDTLFLEHFKEVFGGVGL